MTKSRLARTYYFGVYGILCWREGLPMFIGNQEITPHGYVWWYPWNWVMVLYSVLLFMPYRAAKRAFRKRMR
jgi:hypothetical protein